MKTTKITKATVKSFVKKNFDNLYINVTSSFDGMIDGCRSQHDGFTKVKSSVKLFTVFSSNDCNEHTLGIAGAWFVGQSRDYFRPYNENGFTGIEVYNCCGKFVLAVKA